MPVSWSVYFVLNPKGFTPAVGPLARTTSPKGPFVEVRGFRTKRLRCLI